MTVDPLERWTGIYRCVKMSLNSDPRLHLTWGWPWVGSTIRSVSLADWG